MSLLCGLCHTHHQIKNSCPVFIRKTHMTSKHHIRRHGPSNDPQQDQLEYLHKIANKLHDEFDSFPSKYNCLAKRSLEEAVAWATKAIIN